MRKYSYIVRFVDVVILIDLQILFLLFLKWCIKDLLYVILFLFIWRCYSACQRNFCISCILGLGLAFLLQAHVTSILRIYV